MLIRPISTCQPCYDYRKTSSAMLQKFMESNVDSPSCRKFTPNKKLLKSQLKSKASDYIQGLNLLKQQRGIKKVKIVVEKGPVELSYELQKIYSVMLLVVGDKNDHQFDRDSP